MENQAVKMSVEPQSEEPRTSHSWKKCAKVRWNKQKAQLQCLDKDLQPVQETEQPNKVTRDPQETA